MFGIIIIIGTIASAVSTTSVLGAVGGVTVAGVTVAGTTIASGVTIATAVKKVIED